MSLGLETKAGEFCPCNLQCNPLPKMSNKRLSAEAGSRPEVPERPGRPERVPGEGRLPGPANNSTAPALVLHRLENPVGRRTLMHPRRPDPARPRPGGCISVAAPGRAGPRPSLPARCKAERCEETRSPLHRRARDNEKKKVFSPQGCTNATYIVRKTDVYLPLNKMLAYSGKHCKLNTLNFPLFVAELASLRWISALLSMYFVATL